MSEEQPPIFKHSKKHKTRIFRPYEVKKLISSIPKNVNKDRFEVLLYSGCRYSEIQQLYRDPKFFKGNRINIISTKPKAIQSERHVILNTQGQRSVDNFLRHNKNLPAYNVWDKNLKRWCKYAGIDDDGVSVKSTRKTWESWLMCKYPQHSHLIFLSQGHSELVSLKFYLTLPFTKEDKKAMKYYTDGWVEDD